MQVYSSVHQCDDRITYILTALYVQIIANSQTLQIKSRLKSFVPPVAAAAAAPAAAAESMGSINQSNESSISYPCTVHSADSFLLLPAPRTDVREVVRCDEQRSLEWAIPASAGASRDKFGAKTSQVQPSKRNKSRLHICSSCLCKDHYIGVLFARCTKEFDPQSYRWPSRWTWIE